MKMKQRLFKVLHHKVKQVRQFILKLLAAMIILLLFFSGYSPAMAEANCSSGNFFGLYETDDVTLSGELFVTSNVTIRKNVTLTLEAGTTVTMCGAYKIDVTGGGNLVAIGTTDLPIIISAENPAVHWNSITFSGEANNSVLRHVILNHGGGSVSSALEGTVEFNNLAANPMPSPTLDHVTINDSGAYGMNLLVNSDDENPPSINNITINNSAGAAILANAPTLGGLGSNNEFTNNNPNTIQVVAGGFSRLYHSQTWQDQGIPFELLGSVTVASLDNISEFPELTIKEGITFLMHPDSRLIIGTSLGRGASLVAHGTAESPITFTRLNDVSAPWGNLSFSLYPDTKSSLKHLDLSYGGSQGPAMIYQLGVGLLSLEQVTAIGSQSAGIHVQGMAKITDSRFEENLVGMEFEFSSDVMIRNSVIKNNIMAGINSLDTGANFNRNCIDAIGNNWGSLDGPSETYALADACGNAKTNNGTGDSVSGGVLYEPWLPSESTLQDRGTIMPESFYVIANGIRNTTVTITLRDANGIPLVGKNVQLNATNGTVIQPTQPTDINGITTAIISSTSTGYAYLSAFNLTDNAPISGLGGVTFWQGSGDAGGLISADGAPFASPQLILTGQPFQAGFPVGMSVPMQNSNPYPVEVEVIYGVSRLGIGAGFTTVYTDSITLQPNEFWDAEGVYLPTTTGHQCIQAKINTNTLETELSQTLANNSTARQKNTNQNPCNPETLNPNQVIPTKGGLFGVAKNFYKTYNLAKKVNKCLSDGIGNSPLSTMNTTDTGRDYQQVFLPPTFSPPLIVQDADTTSEQAEILNTMSQTTADLLALNIAIGTTAQRMNWAAQAPNFLVASSSSSLSKSLQVGDNNYYLDLQYQAYRDYVNQYANKLDVYSSQLDLLIAALPVNNNLVFLAEDYVNTKNSLETSGFDAEALDFYVQSGLSNELIDEIKQSLIESFNNQPKESTTFVEALNQIQESILVLSNRLRAQYPIPSGSASLAAMTTTSQSATAVHIPPQIFEFQVGHPLTGQQTVDLIIRPVNLPLSWTYEISHQSVSINEGETKNVKLTLNPGSELIEGDLVQVTVEGYVNGELVGGILMEYLTPNLTPSQSFQVFLPNVIR